MLSGAAGATSQTLVGAEGEVDFVDSECVSHTVVLGGEDGIAGRSLVAGVEPGTSRDGRTVAPPIPVRKALI